MQTVFLAILMAVGAEQDVDAQIEGPVPMAVWDNARDCQCPRCRAEREALAQAMSRPRMSTGYGTNPRAYGHYWPWFGFLSRTHCGPRVAQYPNATSRYYRGGYDYRRVCDFPWRMKPSCVPVAY